MTVVGSTTSSPPPITSSPGCAPALAWGNHREPTPRDSAGIEIRALSPKDSVRRRLPSPSTSLSARSLSTMPVNSGAYGIPRLEGLLNATKASTDSRTETASEESQKDLRTQGPRGTGGEAEENRRNSALRGILRPLCRRASHVGRRRCLSHLAKGTVFKKCPLVFHMMARALWLSRRHRRLRRRDVVGGIGVGPAPGGPRPPDPGGGVHRQRKRSMR